MGNHIKILIFGLLVSFSAVLFSQAPAIEYKPEKEQQFLPYIIARHGGVEALAEFKKNNRYEYLKELWYYSESFYVKRDHLPEGFLLDEAIIDISRYESFRKPDEEAIFILPGCKDALILLPANKLIYKP
jgi:hypothetical protein